MAATAQQILDATNDAILAIISGAQEYAVNGRTYKYADLSTLREMRRELEAEVAEADTGGITTAVVDFMGR